MADLELDIKVGNLSEVANNLGKAFGNIKLPSFGGGKEGGKGTDALFDIGSKALLMLGGIGILLAAAKGVLQPILEQIGMIVQLVVLPLSMMLQTLLRPVLAFALRWLIKLMGAAPAGLTQTAPQTGGVSGYIGTNGQPGQPGPGGAAGQSSAGQNVINYIQQAYDSAGAVLAKLAGFFDFISGFQDKFVAGWNVMTSNLSGFFGSLILNIGTVWNQANIAWDWFNKFFKDLTTAGKGLDVLKDLGMVFSAAFKAVWSAAMLVLQTTLMLTLGPVGIWLWNTIVEPVATAAYNILVGMGSWIWTTVVLPVATTAFNILNGLGQWLYTTITGAIKTAADALTSIYDLGKGIYDALMGAVNAAVAAAGRMLAGAGGSALKAVGIHDAIIAPGGKVITTDPSDYLIATKTPGNLGGGSGSITFGDINIYNPNFTSSSDMNKTVAQFKRSIEMTLKRGGNYAATH